VDAEMRGNILTFREEFPMYRYIYDYWFFEEDASWPNWLCDMVTDYHLILIDNYPELLT
jgi:hypothetical protein